MSKYQPKPRILPTELPLRTPPLAAGQSTRAEGEAIVAEFKDADLRRAYARDLMRIVTVLGRLRRHDVGLWEEKLLKQARAERKRRQEGGLRDA